MQVAVQFDRSSMPAGMVRQNDIGSPSTCTSTPARRRCAVADSPYGPAPTTATSVSGMHISNPGFHFSAFHVRTSKPGRSNAQRNNSHDLAWLAEHPYDGVTDTAQEPRLDRTGNRGESHPGDPLDFEAQDAPQQCGHRPAGESADVVPLAGVQR